MEGECKLDAEVKVALYRIAQEALSNVAKHAGASAASIRLNCQPGQVDLCAGDNGQGFDRATLAPGSLGLGITRERAEAIGKPSAVRRKFHADCHAEERASFASDEASLVA